ncbi:MAG: hypothetical protein OEV73_08200 [Desulfobulbaceae bacterium]|nr:hypothetical protein [Desulfobulbaceae bacterium]
MLAVIAAGVIALGLLVTVGFWVPRLCNRRRLREMLGSRYPLVYLVYAANGPVLVLLGVFLLYRFG